MWEHIRKADIEGAKTQLGLKRAETLRRHSVELSDLEAQLQDIEQFDGIVTAFFEDYMSPEKAVSDSEEQPHFFSLASGSAGE